MLANIENLQQCIDQLILSLSNLKTEIQNASENKENIPLPLPVGTQANDFDLLVEALNSEKWPDAVNKHLICDPNNEEEKEMRGNGILELMVEEDLKDLKFLDYGCGAGYSTKAAAEKSCKLSIGYDKVQFENWKQESDNLMFTNEWNKVVENGPYDVILCFDVVDHSVESIDVILNKIKTVLSENGKVYLRTHPFSSRHANHFYHELNKAYIHLVFTEDELKQINNKWNNHELFENNFGSKTPIISYKTSISDAGFEISYMREMKEEIEPFFETPMVAERIKKTMKMEKFPTFQMKLQFIDFVLIHKK